MAGHERSFATIEQRFARIENDFLVLKWMTGVSLVLATAVFFTQLRLPG